MKKGYLLILLCVATIFMGIGYATINNVTLNFEGQASAFAEKGLVITDVIYNMSGSSASSLNSKINYYTKTMMNSHIELDDEVNSTISYNITVYNNTNYNYLFDQALYDTTGLFYDNNNIEFTLSGISQGSKVKSKHSITFTITFKFKNGFTPSSSNDTDNVLNSYINFKFVQEEPEWYELCRSNSVDLKCRLVANGSPQSDSGINFNQNASNTNGLGLYYVSDTTKTEDLDGDGEGDRVYY